MSLHPPSRTPAFFVAAAALAGAGGFGAVSPVQAQDGPARWGVRGPDQQLWVELGTLFDDELRGVIDDGFPVRVQLHATLWKDRFFDDQVAEYDWRASARRDGAAESYRLEVVPGGQAESESVVAPNLDALTAALRREIVVPLRPNEPGRYYYQFELTVQSLSASDLDELERWLRGEGDPEPASEGDERGALSRGVQRLFVRALGLPSRSLQRRTDAFEWRGR